MNFPVDIYGHNPKKLLTSPAEVARRLQAILSDKVMRFNPYGIDDDALLACAERGRWRPFPALTQMVVFHFHDIRKVYGEYLYEAIFLHIGNDPREIHLPIASLIRQYIYTATLRQVHSSINCQNITNYKMVAAMQGKDYFIGHSLPVQNYHNRIVPAYSFLRLKGSTQTRAATIRAGMINSKITMLNEILAHPYCTQYLQCSRNFIDYTTPINALLTTLLPFKNQNK